MERCEGQDVRALTPHRSSWRQLICVYVLGSQTIIECLTSEGGSSAFQRILDKVHDGSLDVQVALSLVRLYQESTLAEKVSQIQPEGRRAFWPPRWPSLELQPVMCIIGGFRIGLLPSQKLHVKYAQAPCEAPRLPQLSRLVPQQAEATVVVFLPFKKPHVQSRASSDWFAAST